MDLGDITCLWWNADNLFGEHDDPRRLSMRDAYYPTYQDGLDALRRVLESTPDGVPDLVCLGEIGVLGKAANGLSDLQVCLRGAGADRSAWWGEKAGDTLTSCGVLWDDSKLHLVQRASHPVELAWYGYAVGRPILELQFREARSQRDFLVYVNHWTSRATDRPGGSRLEAAQRLLGLLKAQPTNRTETPTLVVGDFNDEPFDLPLRNPFHQKGDWRPDLIARDRFGLFDERRQANKPLLYNPCWRLLGELDLANPPDTRSQAGTFYYEKVEKDRVTRRGWHTFDQVLVNAAMLDGSQPVFDEASLCVLRPPELTGADGRPAGASDHFPLWFMLRFDN